MARSRLPIPDTGPCARHPCDACRTCQRGRCCRTDNPEYRLPKLGEWDGPIYGDLGAVARPDGNHVECHACGELFTLVLAHAWKRHDLTGEEYRALFGLRLGDRLSGADYAELAAERTRERVKRGELRAGAPLPRATPEQLSARAQRVAERNRALGRPSLGELIVARLRTDETYRRTRAERAGHRYLTPEERAEIRRLRPGHTIQDLARAYGVSTSRVHRVLREEDHAAPQD